MKIKSLILTCCLSLAGTAIADTRHTHSAAQQAPAAAKQSAQNAYTPGYCEIELYNDSYDNVTVYGQFDDNSVMPPFSMYTWDAPHIISLYYYGYCHASMYLDIVTFSGYHIYSAYTQPGAMIHIRPYLKKQANESGKSVTVDVQTR